MEEGYITSLSEFRHLTLPQLKLFGRVSKMIEENKKMNKKLAREFKNGK